MDINSIEELNLIMLLGQIPEPPKYMLVYGSLKKGQYNHRLLAQSKFISNITLDNFKMYSLGYYPAIVSSIDYISTIACELYEVDEDTYYRIKNMEIGAGYREKVITVSDEIEAVIYTMDSYKVSHLPLVHGGNWNPTSIRF